MSAYWYLTYTYLYISLLLCIKIYSIVPFYTYSILISVYLIKIYILFNSSNCNNAKFSSLFFKKYDSIFKNIVFNKQYVDSIKISNNKNFNLYSNVDILYNSRIVKFINFFFKFRNFVVLFYFKKNLYFNNINLFFNKINLFFNYYNYKNYTITANLMLFYKKLKKILILLDNCILPSVFKLLTKTNVFYFYLVTFFNFSFFKIFFFNFFLNVKKLI